MNASTALSIVLATVCSVLVGAAGEFHVAPEGDDASPGSAGRPFATLQAAVNILQPGDTLLIHAGVYRETVVFPRSGNAGRPIILKPYRNDKVTVSGCDSITGWTKFRDNIWQAAMPWTLGTGRNQAFSAGNVLIEARYPNTPAPGLEMPVDGLSPLWPTFGEFSIPRDTRVSQPGRIVSNLLDGQPENYWQGALYYGVHFEGWCAQTGVIESSKAGEIAVGDRTNGWWFGSAYGGKFPQDHEEGRGMIVGHMNALDAPGEWHWQDSMLYMITPDGGEPEAVEAKRRQLAFDLSDRAHIQIEGLTIRAASMRMDNSEHCIVDGCDLAYISHFTRQYGIGQIEHGRDTIKSGETGIYLSGRDNEFLNCSIRISAGTGIHLRGYHHTIHNCLIDEVSYTAHYLNAITDAVSDFNAYESFLVGGHVISFNTMCNAGRHFFNFYGNGHSLDSRVRGGMDYAATLFAHNHLYNGMLQTRDAGFITSYYSSGGTLNGVHSQVAYNVLHDCYDISAMRWNKLGMIYLDNGSREVGVHHNLLWAEPGALQSGIWFNPPNINVSDHDNVFHGLFTRTSAELRPEDFPNGKAFRFGHDFDHPPEVPRWPALETAVFPAASCTPLSDGLKKGEGTLCDLQDGDWFSLGPVNLDAGWQSAILRFASAAKGMNTDRSMRKAPRHRDAADPLVFESKEADGREGIKTNWTVQRGADKGWLRFDKVPLGEGYRRVRIVYGTTEQAPRRVEVHLDKPDGPLVSQVLLHATDKPRAGSIQMFEEATGELSAEATGNRDVYFVFRSDDGNAVAEFDYFRFERARKPVALPKNDVRLEIRTGSREGEIIGEFFPRFTGGADDWRDMVAKLEPAHGLQSLFIVVRSALPGPIGSVESITLQLAKPPYSWTGLGVPPLRKWGVGPMIFPEPAHLPRADLAARYRQPTTDRSFFHVKLIATPKMDGALPEWTGRGLELKQSREGATLADVISQAWVGQDADALYIALRNPLKEGTKPLSAGHLWGSTDGVEVALRDADDSAGLRPILSLRGWADGQFTAPDQAGVPAEAVRRLENAVTYRAAVASDAWTCEWRIPFVVFAAAPGALACNLTVRNIALDSWRTWKTGGGATYDLHNGGTLVLGNGESLLSANLKKSLALWLDAADSATIEADVDGKVAAWKDKSGKERHAVQTAAEFRPSYLASGLNDKGTLRFSDAKKTRLEVPDLSDEKITATIFAVISNPDVGLSNNHHQRIFTASDGKANDYICGLSCNLPETQTGGPRQITLEARDRWAKSVRVGCFSPHYQTFLNGDISEILVFNRALTIAERLNITAYLMAKWDL